MSAPIPDARVWRRVVVRALATTAAAPSLCWCCATLLLLAWSPLFCQQPITFQYFYDDLNQLVRVVD